VGPGEVADKDWIVAVGIREQSRELPCSVSPVDSDGRNGTGVAYVDGPLLAFTGRGGVLRRLFGESPIYK
jgi:hypothetical protein